MKTSIFNQREALSEIRRDPTRKAFEKREEMTEAIVRDLKSTGSFFKTELGLFYFQRKPQPLLYPIEHGSRALSALIADRFGVNAAERREYDHILEGLRNEAYSRGEKVAVQRLSHYDSQTGRLYVSRFDGWVYRLNGRDIRQVPNGTDGVFFWDDPSWQSYEVFRGKPRGKSRQGQLKRLIFDSANLSQSDKLSPEDQSWLVSVWLRSHFFGSILPTKTLLLVCGEKGSGKTLALRKWLKLLFGAGGEVTSLERDKQDGFVAAVCSQPVVVFDNVDESVGWLADLLAQVATGISFKRRELYTTNTSVGFKPQCFVALTSRTPKFIEGRDDLLDRTLILQAERRREFKGEEGLLEEIAQNRNSLWTELLRGLNQLLSVTPPAAFRTSGASRMADFAGFAVAVAKFDGDPQRANRVLDALEGRRSETLLSEEPIFLCLEKWLQTPGNQGREVSSGDLQKELRAITAGTDITWPYKSAHSLGQKLSHITTNLAERFQVETYRDSANQLRYRFKPPSATGAA